MQVFLVGVIWESEAITQLLVKVLISSDREESKEEPFGIRFGIYNINFSWEKKFDSRIADNNG